MRPHASTLRQSAAVPLLVLLLAGSVNSQINPQSGFQPGLRVVVQHGEVTYQARIVRVIGDRYAVRYEIEGFNLLGNVTADQIKPSTNQNSGPTEAERRRLRQALQQLFPTRAAMTARMPELNRQIQELQQQLSRSRPPGGKVNVEQMLAKAKPLGDRIAQLKQEQTELGRLLTDLSKATVEARAKAPVPPYKTLKTRYDYLDAKEHRRMMEGILKTISPKFVARRKAHIAAVDVAIREYETKQRAKPKVATPTGDAKPASQGPDDSWKEIFAKMPPLEKREIVTGVGPNENIAPHTKLHYVLKILDYPGALRAERAANTYVKEHGLDAYLRYRQEQDQRYEWLLSKTNGDDRDVSSAKAREALSFLWEQEPVAFHVYSGLCGSLYGRDPQQEKFIAMIAPGSMTTSDFSDIEYRYMLKRLNLNPTRSGEIKRGMTFLDMTTMQERLGANWRKLMHQQKLITIALQWQYTKEAEPYQLVLKFSIDLKQQRLVESGKLMGILHSLARKQYGSRFSKADLRKVHIAYNRLLGKDQREFGARLAEAKANNDQEFLDDVEGTILEGQKKIGIYQQCWRRRRIIQILTERHRNTLQRRLAERATYVDPYDQLAAQLTEMNLTEGFERLNAILEQVGFAKAQDDVTGGIFDSSLRSRRKLASDQQRMIKTMPKNPAIRHSVFATIALQNRKLSEYRKVITTLRKILTEPQDMHLEKIAIEWLELPAPQDLLVGDPMGAAKQAAPLRTWKSADGRHRTEARFVSVAGENVELKKRDGQVVTVPLKRLSREDREYLRQQNRPKENANALCEPVK